MSYQSVWYFTKMPEEIIDFFIKDLGEDFFLTDAAIDSNTHNENIRKSKVGWIHDTNWFSALVYSYVLKANRENFLYNIDKFEGNNLQYTQYGNENFYKWHTDDDISNSYQPTGNNEIDAPKILGETIRKLTVSVQLSNPSEYEGGELQIMSSNSKIYTVPKERGTIVVFDSRAIHRVRKIKSGVRKSLVGWATGPRWK